MNAIYHADSGDDPVDDQLIADEIMLTLFEAYEDVLFEVWMTEEDTVEL